MNLSIHSIRNPVPTVPLSPSSLIFHHNQLTMRCAVRLIRETYIKLGNSHERPLKPENRQCTCCRVDVIWSWKRWWQNAFLWHTFHSWHDPITLIFLVKCPKQQSTWCLNALSNKMQNIIHVAPTWRTIQIYHPGYATIFPSQLCCCLQTLNPVSCCQ